MAKYVLKEPEMDILKVTSISTIYMLEDGTTKSVPVQTVGDTYHVVQDGTFISAADLEAKYEPAPLA